MPFRTAGKDVHFSINCILLTYIYNCLIWDMNRRSELILEPGQVQSKMTTSRLFSCAINLQGRRSHFCKNSVVGKSKYWCKRNDDIGWCCGYKWGLYEFYYHLLNVYDIYACQLWTHRKLFLVTQEPFQIWWLHCAQWTNEKKICIFRRVWNNSRPSTSFTNLGDSHNFTGPFL